MKLLIVLIAVSVLFGCNASLPATVEQDSPTSGTLTWQIPTRNENGSLLTDLKGFTIYLGTSPTLYSTGDRIVIDNPYTTSWQFTELSINVDYYIMMTAHNVSGAESAPSSVISFRLSR